MKNILLVDDSALMRRVLCDIIESDKRFRVQDRAVNGLDALNLLSRKTYDAVILDVNMPQMNGLELLKELQKRRISAKVIMASTDTKDGAKITLDALDLGALDFVHKPNNTMDCRNGEFKDRLLEILATVAEMDPPRITASAHVATRFGSRTGSGSTEQTAARLGSRAGAASAAGTAGGTEQTAARPGSRAGSAEQTAGASPASGTAGVSSAPGTAGAPDAGTRYRRDAAPPSGKAVYESGSQIVALASSTGGPKALQSVIPKLPANMKAPMVIVQHMPAGFTASLAERLDSLSKVSVKEAREGDVLEAGTVYVAMGGKHLNVLSSGGRYTIHYTDEPPREGVKPCANYMYESLKDSRFDRIVCVVMTGMGADGTQGIENLKKNKRIHVIAQEASTCAVYGMPKSTVNAGLADQVVPLEQIAEEIITNVGVK